MKIQNYLVGIGLALGVLLTSCEQDNEKPIYAGTTMGVTFGFNSQSVDFPSEGYEGFDVEVIRAQSGEAVTIPLSAVMLDAAGNSSPVPATIQVPSSVSFEADEKVSSFHVSVGDIESGVTYQLAVTMANEEYAPIDNISSKTISIYRDYTYTSLGIGEFYSPMWGGGPYPVEIQKADQVEWYKLVGLIEEGYDITIQMADDGVTATIPEQICCADLNGTGAGVITAEGELENGVFTFTTTYLDDVYMYGPVVETITLPEAVSGE